MVKASAYNAGDPGSVPGSGRSPGEGNGNALRYSCLENPMVRGAWQATIHGVAKSQTRLSNFTFTKYGKMQESRFIKKFLLKISDCLKASFANFPRVCPIPYPKFLPGCIVGQHPQWLVTSFSKNWVGSICYFTVLSLLLFNLNQSLGGIL